MSLINLEGNKHELKDYILVIPSISVGNVPQLTIDILILTYKMKKIGTIWHPAIIPAVGNDQFAVNSKRVCMGSELFSSVDHQLAVIQFRSGLEQKYANSFFEALTDNIKTLELKSVLILGSTFSYEMHNVNSSKYRYLSNSQEVSLLESNNIIRASEEEIIHGVGLAIQLYGIITKADLECTLLVRYTSEGDNCPDAVQLLELLQKLMVNLQSEKELTVKLPCSLIQGFGNPPCSEIY